MRSFHNDGKKIPTQRDQKQLYINVRRRADIREEKKEKHQIRREISGIYYKIIDIAYQPIFLYLSFIEEQ